ncbi:hypothetical protein ACV22V_03515, partial [Burkholderia sp. AW33-5]
QGGGFCIGAAEMRVQAIEPLRLLPKRVAGILRLSPPRRNEISRFDTIEVSSTAACLDVHVRTSA